MLVRACSPLLLLSLLAAVLLGGCDPRESGPISSPHEQSQAKVRFNRAILTASLDSLLSWHDARTDGWRSAPGVRRDAIAAEFEDCAFVVPEELLMIWGFSNGGSNDAAFVGSHRLVSAADARAAYDSMRADASIAWRPNWIPTLRDGSAWIAVDASRSSAPAGPLLRWTPTDEPYVVSTNFTWLLRTWAVAIERGLVPHDVDAIAALHREFNDDLPGPWAARATDTADSATH